MEISRYIIRNTKCCLWSLKLCKMLPALEQNLKGKSGQRKQWDLRWVAFPYILIAFCFMFKSDTFREAFLHVLWKNCLPGSLLSFIFSASKIVLARLISLLLMDCVTFQSSILFPKLSQQGNPHPLSPKLQPQPQALPLLFPTLLMGRGQILNRKVKLEHLRWEGTPEFVPSFLWDSPCTIYLVHEEAQLCLLWSTPRASTAILDNVSLLPTMAALDWTSAEPLTQDGQSEPLSWSLKLGLRKSLSRDGKIENMSARQLGCYGIGYCHVDWKSRESSHEGQHASKEKKYLDGFLHPVPASSWGTAAACPWVLWNRLNPYNKVFFSA